ncbi:hypothetical protein ACI1TM_09115 [Lactococcus garvieae]|uniref:hypothetical protein n=1 Tax=Lactococcus garvieae TaxID=1363 RepID=UPI00385193F4
MNNKTIELVKASCKVQGHGQQTTNSILAVIASNYLLLGNAITTKKADFLVDIAFQYIFRTDKRKSFASLLKEKEDKFIDVLAFEREQSEKEKANK